MTDGMPAIFIDDVKSCKKQVMSNYGVNVVMSILPIKEPFSFLATASVIETLREHRSRYGGSPFRGDCPKDGPFTILITWTNPDGSQGGHSVMCEITEEDYCLETGSVRITCYEHPSQGGGVSTLTINSGGYVSPGGSGSNPSNPGGYIPIGAHVGSYTQ
ncbi:MAG: hypothetical protein US31_C0030G0003 [Berkelbacteria bacterium GW2011_GWA1_36_9]|uniref:Uncharacterized protein n=1 Tax=Berkelbacteria bacterium GW2011_GWA1_36_9 TaxID=1618331 RepID=A0A0G0HWU7_9BACT|nr:MAG: hypothetical protein US31_C0030G0003 [Berkelbacteria bacterium GW2011_GWA1_36_9]